MDYVAAARHMNPYRWAALFINRAWIIASEESKVTLKEDREHIGKQCIAGNDKYF